MKQHKFDESHILHQLGHYLPGQLALKDFVHHNSLHSFQDQPFFDGIFNACDTFGIVVTFNMNEYRKLHQQGRIKESVIESVIDRIKGPSDLISWKQKMLSGSYDHPFNPRIGRIRAHWKSVYKVDIQNMVQPLLFRIINSYLDQGIALWHFPFEDEGLINAIKRLDKNSYASFFKTARAKQLLHSEDLSIHKLLDILVGKEEYFEGYILDQQFSHKGWSGLVNAIEHNPNTLLYSKKIELKDFIILELLLEIDALDKKLGAYWKPLAWDITIPPIDYWAKHTLTELEEVLQLWQEAFEWDYYDEVLAGLQFSAKQELKPIRKNPTFQTVHCVDDRECSFRRHLELVDPDCETYGAPGYFGAAIYFQPFGGQFYEKNCPVAITPKHLIKEIEVPNHRGKSIIHTKNSHTLFKGFFVALSLGIWSAFRLIKDLFKPEMQADISDAFAHMNIAGKLKVECTDTSEVENGLQLGYTISEMVDIVYDILRGMGLTETFSPVVYIMAHGSSSANNPHHGAHDCGACSGRPGSINARVYAYMANHAIVRGLLSDRGLKIPNSTQFLGGMHDTASDEVAFYDVNILTEVNLAIHKDNVKKIEIALDDNAVERARRFASIDIKKGVKHVRQAIKHRSVSYFEPRPELGHGSNALCYVGGRNKIKGLFLDRRAFLQSYDYRQDLDGSVLANVLAPLPAVCGGINLEYYFSRMDLEKMGAGTKLPHNVMGLIGVANSSDGDLRPGLPLQMVENHDPVRLLMMIEHFPEVVNGILERTPSMKSWFEDGWLHLVVLSPDTNELYYYNNGRFEPYDTIKKINVRTTNIKKHIAEAPEMVTNDILDATKENMPVHVYENH